MQQLNDSGLRLALALAAIAGFVDAIGFIALGGHFVSFMSGNSTRLAVDAAGSAWREGLFGLGLIALFVAGVAGGQLIGHGAPSRIKRLLLVQAALLLAAAWCFRADAAAAAVPAMVVAMGMANATLARDGSSPPGVTYMTGALVRIGLGIAGAARGERTAIWPWLALWLALVGGAATGGALTLRWGGVVLLLPALALLVLGWATERDRHWHNPSSPTT